MEGFIEDFEASDGLRRRAHRLIPGGAHTYAKGDDQYPVLSPGFIARGDGCHVWDVDGNVYIEYGMGNRAVGLGPSPVPRCDHRTSHPELADLAIAHVRAELRVGDLDHAQLDLVDGASEVAAA